MQTEIAVRRLPVLAALALLLALVSTSCGSGTRGTIRIGYYGDCWGPFTTNQEWGTAGAELPFIRRGATPSGSKPSDGVGSVTIAGKRVELVVDCEYYGSIVSELAAVRRLVEQQGVDILVTPNHTPDLGEVLYAPHQPHVAFISTGLVPVPTRPNLFRVSMGFRQASAGLGAYAYHTLGWRTAATFGEDDPLGWSLTSGFVAEFCSLGGTVVKRSWAPAEITNWSPLVRRLPRGVDGVALFNGIQSPKTFFPAYKKLQPDLRRHMVMSVTAILQGAFVPGIMTAGFFPAVPVGPAWTRYFREFRAAFPQYIGGAYRPEPIDAYDAVELALEAIERVHGDLSDGERRLMAALPTLHFQTPVGTTLRLDRNHQAVGPNYLIRVEKAANGNLVPRTVGVIPNVDESFGGYFTANSPPYGETQPVCRKGHVPAWAR